MELYKGGFYPDGEFGFFDKNKNDFITQSENCEIDSISDVWVVARCKMETDKDRDVSNQSVSITLETPEDTKLIYADDKTKYGDYVQYSFNVPEDDGGIYEIKILEVYHEGDLIFQAT